MSAVEESGTAARVDVIPFTRIRSLTAEHMVRSKATSAHALVVVEVDYGRVDEARRAAAAEFRETEGFSLTYLPFIARAAVDAITEFPRVNASVDEKRLVVHHDINIGVAVDLSFEGLLAPVLRNAQDRGLREIARAVADLARRARTKKLSASELADGTFTITNLGQYGTLITSPVINQPQIAILSTDGVRERPAVTVGYDGTKAIGIRPIGNLALAWDHRAVDGAYAAAFLARIRDILEGRDWAAEL